MKLPSKKLNAAAVIALALDIAFLLVLIFDALAIKNLYQTLNQPPPYQSISRIVRINTANLNKAVDRYNAAVNYALPPKNVTDPFSNPVPKVQ